MESARKLAQSSTFLAAIILPTLWAVANKNGVEIPWEVLAIGMGAYGAKETASKVAPTKNPPPVG